MNKRQFVDTLGNITKRYISREKLVDFLPMQSQGLLRRDSSESKIASIGRTLILLDWDDTIHPSCWFVDNEYEYPYVEEIKSRPDIIQLSTKALEFLRACVSLGDVMIVTNAELGWVEMSSCTLLPDVAK